MLFCIYTTLLKIDIKEVVTLNNIINVGMIKPTI